MSNFRTYGVALLATVTFLFSSAAVALTVDDLVGTWNMTYDMGQGAMSGTIVISMNDDGSPAISLNTSGGGSSQASDIVIEGEEINFSRSVSAQGQSVGVDYTATLVDGKLEGSFELDLGGGATPWTATRQ